MRVVLRYCLLRYACCIDELASSFSLAVYSFHVFCFLKEIDTGLQYAAPVGPDKFAQQLLSVQRTFASPYI
jgi:hypothetical protein